MSKRLEVVAQGLSSSPSGGAIVLDCIYAQIVISQQAEGFVDFALLFHGIGINDWAGGFTGGSNPGIISQRYTLPVVYDTDGTPIPYKQRLTISPPKGVNTGYPLGMVMQVRVAE